MVVVVDVCARGHRPIVLAGERAAGVEGLRRGPAGVACRRISRGVARLVRAPVLLRALIIFHAICWVPRNRPRPACSERRRDHATGDKRKMRLAHAARSGGVRSGLRYRRRASYKLTIKQSSHLCTHTHTSAHTHRHTESSTSHYKPQFAYLPCPIGADGDGDDDDNNSGRRCIAQICPTNR